MSILENFKNIPRSLYGGATGLKCNFFSNLQRSPWSKKKEGPVAPQRATGGLSPSPRATAGPSPRARQGGLSPPSGDRGNPLI